MFWGEKMKIAVRKDAYGTVFLTAMNTLFFYQIAKFLSFIVDCCTNFIYS